MELIGHPKVGLTPRSRVVDVPTKGDREIVACTLPRCPVVPGTEGDTGSGYG